ncbi:hypothetical protein EVAR_92615_1 [Eumeta japonica]|uniref:Uncharacterized protein n=1 Tax=Eumeta variegata TaxID=151549 RepID=A0A4C1SZM7_EUMVA|nr:hypothetical protein EVAR_92615_1 [Eumeta japonica]
MMTGVWNVKNNLKLPTMDSSSNGPSPVSFWTSLALLEPQGAGTAPPGAHLRARPRRLRMINRPNGIGTSFPTDIKRTNKAPRRAPPPAHSKYCKIRSPLFADLRTCKSRRGGGRAFGGN